MVLASVATATSKSEQNLNEQMTRAQYFVCHERHVFHRYCVLGTAPAFPLLFMDRAYDWQYEDGGDVPIMSRYNGFMELVCREAWTERTIGTDELAVQLQGALARDSHVALPISLVHDDGTPYITEWLIEAIDDDNTVYYTKTSPDPSFRALSKPVLFHKLIDSLYLDANGGVAVTEVASSSSIDAFMRQSVRDAFRSIFRAYGFREYDGRLSRYVTPVVVSVRAFDDLIAGWMVRRDAIVSAGQVMFNDQSRLNKHIQNRFKPVQYGVRALLQDTACRADIGAALCAELDARDLALDGALEQILKFSSLVMQRTTDQSFDLYLKHLERLRAEVRRFQVVFVQVQQRLSD